MQSVVLHRGGRRELFHIRVDVECCLYRGGSRVLFCIGVDVECCST